MLKKESNYCFARGSVAGRRYWRCIAFGLYPANKAARKSRLMRCAIQDNILIRYMGEQNVPGSFWMYY